MIKLNPLLKITLIIVDFFALGIGRRVENWLGREMAKRFSFSDGFLVGMHNLYFYLVALPVLLVPKPIFEIRN